MRKPKKRTGKMPKTAKSVKISAKMSNAAPHKNLKIASPKGVVAKSGSVKRGTGKTEPASQPARIKRK
jgi:hypothetical protein